MKAPLLDARDTETIIRQLRELVPYYTPEWKADDDRDPGVAVMKLFAGMYRGILDRLNQVQGKHYIAYLDMLGIKRMPARSSRVPLTFHLSTGASEPVLIPARTGAAAPDRSGGKPIPFETERAIVATPAKLVEAVAVDPAADTVIRAPGGFLDGPIAPFSTRLATGTDASGGKLLLTSAEGLKPGDVLLVSTGAGVATSPSAMAPAAIQGGSSTGEYVEVAAVKGLEVTPSAPIGNLPEGAAVTRLTSFELWEGRNQQAHVLYLGHAELFQLSSPVGIDLRLMGDGEDSGVLAKRYGQLVRWEYWSEEGRWKPFLQDAGGGRLMLRKTGADPFGEREINGIVSRWIRGTYIGGAASLVELRIRSIAATIVHSGTAPELAFSNDVPIDAKGSFYPFGGAPRLYDTLYLAHDETLSKRGSSAKISFKLKHEKSDGSVADVTTARLSWEYWNGRGWMALPGVTEHFQVKPSEDRSLTFTVPDDLAETIVLGQQRRWIRVRIVSGDYGREELQGDKTYRLVPQYIVPCLSNLKFQSEMATAAATNLQHAIAFNQLTYVDYTSALRSWQAIEPFAMPDTNRAALYLGFDAPPLKGSISLYFSMAEQAYGEDARPRLVWEYYRSQGGQSGWGRLDVRDDTEHLTKSGCIEFVGPADLAPATRFGRRLYWLRALDAESLFVPTSRRPAQPNASASANVQIQPAAGRKLQPDGALALEEASEDCGCGCGAAPCDEEAQWFGTSPEDAVPGFAPSPKLLGIHRNTTMAVQAESVQGETLGSSRGTAGLAFAFAKSPVLAEEVEIDERSALSEGERKAIRESGEPAYRETLGDDGETAAFWVRWSRTDDLSASSPDDRHYELDPTTGAITFGDGIHGRIPPVGTDNIRCSYQAGGGSRGNVARGELSMLRTSIAYVDRVGNPEPAEGGFDTEPIERVVERGPERVRHRGRAVTAKDYEELAAEAAQGLAKVKCLPGVNDRGQAESGWISVVIVPQSGDERPRPSIGLRGQVLDYLRARASNVAAAPGRVRVTGPAYIEVTVTALIVADDFTTVPLLEREATRRIKAYLHPLTGGDDGRGWPFGTLPALSDFYALLERLPHADHVEKLSMTLRDEGSGRTLDISPEKLADVRALPQALVCAGEPSIAIKPPTSRSS